MNHVIYVAGGCFWGVEAFFKKLEGIEDTICGYANSIKKAPTYEEVCSGQYEAVECVKLIYDDSKISLTQVISAFFAIIDPTSLNQQGGDIGVQYRTGIYLNDQSQEEPVEQVLKQIQTKYALPVVTEVLPLLNFFPAEAYHQDYLNQHPDGYCHLNLPKAWACMKELDIKTR